MLSLDGLKFSLSAIALAVSATVASAATVVIETNGQFIVPDAVDSITVLLIGGGAAGAGSHYAGGSSGYLAGGTFSVNGGDVYNVTVGAGGASAGCAGNQCVGGNGTATSFGMLLTALGGNASVYGTAGNGGSGGGGAGNMGYGGAGGTGGADGISGQTYSGGIGQGTATWASLLGLITELSVTAGAGGASSSGTHDGGGGGGGILIDGFGLSGGNGAMSGFTPGQGGIGYGAGGGSGGYSYLAGGYQVGGSGAGGVVIVEYEDAAPVPLPASFGLLFAGCGALALRKRRKA